MRQRNVGDDVGRAADILGGGSGRGGSLQVSSSEHGPRESRELSMVRADARQQHAGWLEDRGIIGTEGLMRDALGVDEQRLTQRPVVGHPMHGLLQHGGRRGQRLGDCILGELCVVPELMVQELGIEH